jgi:hypothetical protein
MNDDDVRYYIADNRRDIMEYPAKILHSPGFSIPSGECAISMRQEYDVAHQNTIFRLNREIAEAAIESWKRARTKIEK